MSSHAQPLVPARSAVASPAGRAGAGRADGHRPLRLHAGLAADGARRRALAGTRRLAGLGQLRGLPAGRVDRGRVAAAPAAGRAGRQPAGGGGADPGHAAAHSVAGWAALRLAAGWASALGFICVASWRPARAGDPIEPAASAVVYAGVGAGIAATGLACLALMAAGATAAQCWVALGAGAGLVDGRLAQTARGAAGHRRVRPPIQPGTAAARHGGTGVALRRVRHRLHHSRHLPARHGQGSHARSGGVRLGLAPVRTGRRAVLPDGA